MQLSRRQVAPQASAGACRRRRLRNQQPRGCRDALTSPPRSRQDCPNCRLTKKLFHTNFSHPQRLPERTGGLRLGTSTLSV